MRRNLYIEGSERMGSRPLKILAMDIGAGTIDILLHETGSSLENSFVLAARMKRGFSRHCLSDVPCDRTRIPPSRSTARRR